MPPLILDVQLSAIAPEIAVAAGALLLLVIDTFVPQRVPRIYLPWTATAVLGAAVALAVVYWGRNELQLSGMVALDGFAVFVKVALAAFGLLSIWLGHEYLKREKQDEAEFYGLMLFAIAGMMLLAAASDLIVLFIALETFSIAIYVLVAFRRGAVLGEEAAMKYFLIGAFSSAFFLLGIALAYGAVGTTRYYGAAGAGGQAGILAFLRTTPAEEVGLLIVAVAFLIVALGFKVAAVPFHAWTPDAYQGAPSPVTGFMAAATKLAAFAAILRLFDVVLFSLRWDWQPILSGLAVATMIVGSLFAVVQEDVKRILAYSSIAHAGFVLTAVIAANDESISTALFYLAAYGIIIIGAFAVVAALAGTGERRVRLADYRGVFHDYPLLSGALTLFLLALAGVPFTSGFVAKLVVFGAAVEGGYWWLAVAGAVASVIAAFFYLRITVVMYMQERHEHTGPLTLTLGPIARGVIGLTAFATVLLGVYWGPLIGLAEDALVFFS